MKINNPANKNQGTPIRLPDKKRTWIVCFVFGALLWIIGLILWIQGGIDEAILFHFNPQRIAKTPIVILSKWLSSYGMAAITIIFVLYLLISQKYKTLDAPLTV